MLTSNEIDIGPSLLKRFTLVNLNGYKTVSLHSAYRVKIVAGENGAGKTSLLNSLYSVLAGKQAILYQIDFESLELEWSNGEILSARKADLFTNINREEVLQSPFFDFLTDNGISIDDGIDLLQLFVIGDDGAIQGSDAYHTLFRDTPFDKEYIYERLQRAAEGASKKGSFDTLHTQVKKQLGDIAVLYLPTYRRIEADLFEFRTRPRPGLRRSRAGKDVWDSDRLINFGLEDVENRLREISTEIRRETLQAYSLISGKTLEELINVDSQEEPMKESIDFASIRLILSRIGKQSTNTESRLQSLIDSREIYTPPYIQLRKFLLQLLQVYTGRQQDENAIEGFATLINDYLSLGGDPEKDLVFDKQKVELHVINRYTKKSLPLGALSSGEKQIVSVFARLLLDPKKRYFIIIDEPELSLSIEWQQKFLTDISATKNCGQLIAITHSPFIYQNNLSPYAGSLEIQLQSVISANSEGDDNG